MEEEGQAHGEAEEFMSLQQTFVRSRSAISCLSVLQAFALVGLGVDSAHELNGCPPFHWDEKHVTHMHIH